MNVDDKGNIQRNNIQLKNIPGNNIKRKNDMANINCKSTLHLIIKLCLNTAYQENSI